MKEAKAPEDIQFELFNPGHQESKVNIPFNIDPTDPLTLLNLFIPDEIYIIITENTNLYVLSKNTPTAPIKSNTRY